MANLTRSGYTGQQKYGTMLWSGDTYASWDTFKKQIVAGLNFCASGLPYWTLDIGAFFVKQGTPWYWSGEYEGGTDDLGYRELYTRWFQYGAFLPVFRANGTDVRREVWAFGQPGGMVYDALVKAIELRCRLMPYIYSLAADVWHNDSTMMRMLAFDFPDDKKALEVKDQYMFGKSIMFALSQHLCIMMSAQSLWSVMNTAAQSIYLWGQDGMIFGQIKYTKAEHI